MYEYSHMGGFGIGMIFFWLLVFAAIVWIVMSTLSNKRPDSTKLIEESALEVLKRRYAQGEIDDDEFQNRKKRLEEK